MTKSLLIAAAFCMASCSQAEPSDSKAQSGPQLPTKFVLNCRAPAGASIPDGTKGGFKILINRAANQFSFSWERLGPWPIQKIEPGRITLADAHIEHGIDGNPEDRKIVFDRRNNILQFHEAYSGFVPIEHTFSAHCEVANA